MSNSYNKSNSYNISNSYDQTVIILQIGIMNQK